MHVILSIKPEYADKILDGTKKFEFRKVGFSAQPIDIVLLYATMPVGKIVGEFEVKKIHIDKPNIIWNMTKKYAGIDKQFFDTYYCDRNVAVAIEVKTVRKYNTPIDLSDLGEGLKAPQSFRYYDAQPDQQLTLPI